MDAVKALKQLSIWHDLIKPDMSDEDLVTLYQKFVIEEIQELQEATNMGNIVKECVDVIVVTNPIIYLGNSHQSAVARTIRTAMMDMLNDHLIEWWSALAAVNKSNFSKLILDAEADQAMDYFESLGIEVEIISLSDGYMGAYSRKDQTVNGKFYAKDKLLKGPNYSPIDESIEWWAQ